MQIFVAMAWLACSYGASPWKRGEFSLCCVLQGCASPEVLVTCNMLAPKKGHPLLNNFVNFSHSGLLCPVGRCKPGAAHHLQRLVCPHLAGLRGGAHAAHAAGAGHLRGHP